MTRFAPKKTEKPIYPRIEIDLVISRRFDLKGSPWEIFVRTRKPPAEMLIIDKRSELRGAIDNIVKRKIR